MKFRHLVALLSFFYAFSCWASDSFIVKDIRVEGIQRTEAGTVFSYLRIKVGDVLDEDKATNFIGFRCAMGRVGGSTPSGK